jgi:eukaryotic-like serine/threonine-protein kinase
MGSVADRGVETTRLTRAGGGCTVVLTPDGSPCAKPAEPRLRTGANVGRFVVLEQVGQGGMGRVLRGYDPKLRREVALKLMRTSSSNTADRMLREAQAMARLSHPNVVPVYDVGEHGGAVFIAMEYVEGRTVRVWCESDRPGWRAVVRVFVEAGRGLAAAHRAGLVHRDFKPDNVLVERGTASDTVGRARVMDFGIARAAEEFSSCAEDGLGMAMLTGEAPTTGSLALVRRAELTEGLTEVGTLVGTPAYMAPEQHRGEPADARSDQYAYCVALFEALFGVRPFSGKSLAELAAQKERGQLRVPASISAPRWIRRIVLRGLSPQPDARWPSIEALVDALGDDPRRKWTRGAVVAGGVLSLGAAAVTIAEARSAACTGAAARLEGIWDTPRSADVGAALRATGVVHAEQTANRVRQRLDDYSMRWVQSHTDACTLHRRGEQSQALLDARMACLQGRRLELAALVDMLTAADADVAHQAVDAVAALPAVDRCDDPEHVQAQVSPPDDPRVAARVESVRARLAEAWALQSAGKYGDGLSVVDRAIAEAEGVDYPPLQAEIAYRRGWALEGTGVYEDALEHLSAAYFGARRTAMDELAGRAASAIVFVLARLARHDEALAWAEHARVEVERFGSDADRGYLMGVIAIVHDSMGSYEEARRLHEEALELRIAAHGTEHHAVAQSLNNLARVLYAEGSYDEARENFERAREIWEATRGPEHPSVGQALNNIAAVWLEQEEHERARPLYERALAIWEGAHGPDHPAVATALNNLALVHRVAGRWAEAGELHARALAIHERSLGPEHPLVATSLKNLARVRSTMGEGEEAGRLYARALAIREKALGPEHPYVASVLASIAELSYDSGDLDEAERSYRRALAIFEQAHDPSHPDVADPLTGLAEIALDRGRSEEAIALLERAMAIRGQDHVPATDLAETQLPLARALWAAGDRGRALELSRAAVRAFREAGEGRASSLAEAEAWLAEIEG